MNNANNNTNLESTYALCHYFVSYVRHLVDLVSSMIKKSISEIPAKILTAAISLAV